MPVKGKDNQDEYQPFCSISLNTKEHTNAEMKSLLKDKKDGALENYFPNVKTDINSERHKFKDKDGKVIRYYADGGLVFCRDLNNYVQVSSFDRGTGIYKVKMKNKDLEERILQLEQEAKAKVKVGGETVFGYHVDFLNQ